MLRDEEREAIEWLKRLVKLNKRNNLDDTFAEILKNLIEKQSKEIEELKEKNKPQPDCAEPIERTEEMVNMRWVNHNYILKTESEQKEKQAYIDGTNIADQLCNEKWVDKIKAFIKEELPDDEICSCCEIFDINGIDLKRKLQSLLEKEE